MPTAAEKRAERAATKAAEKATPIEKINEAAFANPGAVPSAAGPIAQPDRSGATVFVVCKIGVSNLDLQMTKMEDKFEQNTQGGRQVREGSRFGKVVRLRGTSYPRGTPPKGFPPPPQIVGGGAINPGIDAAWWNEWVTQNKLNPLVVNGLIFASESESYVIGRLREEAGIQSGLEPVDPERMDKDPRVPRSTRGEVSDVATGEGRGRSAA